MAQISVKTSSFAIQEINLFTIKAKIDILEGELNSLSKQIRTVSDAYREVSKTIDKTTAAMKQQKSSVSSMKSVLGQVKNLYDNTEKDVKGIFQQKSDGINWTGTVYMGKVSASQTDGDTYGEVNAYVGKVKAETTAKFKFMDTKSKTEYQDGEWTDKDSFEVLDAELGIGIAASAVSVDGKVKSGDDLLGSELSGEIDVLAADAEGKGKLSIGEDGVNAYAKGKLMVSAVEGKGSTTINFLGFKITGSATGYAGALGVEGKAGLEDGEFTLEGGVAAALGFSLGISVGLNDTGKENVNKFVDFITFWD
jgi:hypothetical protein